MGIEVLPNPARVAAVEALANGTAWSDVRDDILEALWDIDPTWADSTLETMLTAEAAVIAAEQCPGPATRLATAEAAVTPVFTSITPATGDPGGGERVVIVGTGFQPGATVTIGSHAQTVVTVNPTTIVIKTVAHAAAAAAALVITNPDTTTVTEAAAFTFTAVDDPTFTSITPDTGTKNGGTICHIVGTKFRAGVVVKFGTTQATVLNMTDTDIWVTTPRHAAGKVTLKITNLNAQYNDAAEAFTFV
jgi:hypothetical protein